MAQSLTFWTLTPSHNLVNQSNLILLDLDKAKQSVVMVALVDQLAASYEQDEDRRRTLSKGYHNLLQFSWSCLEPQ